MHGFLTRASEDVDLFTVADAPGMFADAVAEAVTAYRSAGMNVVVSLETPSFARLILTDTNGEEVRVELGVDWRGRAPVSLDIGPVLHQDDAVANKIAALYGRGEVRDYIDVAAVLGSRRYTSEELIGLAVNADPGFDIAMFVDALKAIQRLPDRAFLAHGVTGEQVTQIRGLILGWASGLGR
jgi:hypothetical protein